MKIKVGTSEMRQQTFLLNRRKKLPRESERSAAKPLSSKQAGVRMKNSLVQTYRKLKRMNTKTGMSVDNLDWYKTVKFDSCPLSPLLINDNTA